LLTNNFSINMQQKRSQQTQRNLSAGFSFCTIYYFFFIFFYPYNRLCISSFCVTHPLASLVQVKLLSFVVFNKYFLAIKNTTFLIFFSKTFLSCILHCTSICHCTITLLKYKFYFNIWSTVFTLVNKLVFLFITSPFPTTI
jgi:hypothetical protein